MENTEKKEPVYFAKFIVLSVIFWLLAASWLGIVYYYFTFFQLASSIGSVSQIILTYLSPYISLDPGIEMLHISDQIIAFAVLSSLSYAAIYLSERISSKNNISKKYPNFNKSRKWVRSILVIWIAIIVSSAIEYTQIFIPGQSVRLIDILIALMGVCVVLLLIRIIMSIAFLFGVLLMRRNQSRD